MKYLELFTALLLGICISFAIALLFISQSDEISGRYVRIPSIIYSQNCCESKE